MKLIDNLLDSFNNSNAGWSARKLTAFTMTALATGAIFIWYYELILDAVWATSIYTQILIILLVAAAFFLGLITFTQILELKNGNAPSAPEPPQQPTTDETPQS